jgi:uncharacterized protein (TIGR02996 family)
MALGHCKVVPDAHEMQTVSASCISARSETWGKTLVHRRVAAQAFRLAESGGYSSCRFAESCEGRLRIVKIKRDGNQLTITKDGKKTVRKFVTPEQAIAAHDKLVAENESERAERAAAPRVDPRHPALEQVIANAPEDPAGYAVYADWLESQGDPRGRLIALQLAGKPIKQELAANRKYFLGPLTKYLKHEVFRWELGFIHDVSFNGIEGARVEDILEQLLQHPSGRFLVHAGLGPVEQDIQPAVDLLARAAPTTLRSLHVVGSPSIDVRPLLGTLPRLRDLSLVYTPCPELAHDALETLRIVGGPLPVVSDAVKLRRLGLVDVDGDELRLISTLDLTRLERLEVQGSKDVGRLVHGLPELPRLDWLDLSSNRMTDADAFALAQRREGLPQLTYVNVWGNELTPAGVAAIRRLAADVFA